MNIVENGFCYHVKIYLGGDSKLDSSEQGSEMEFAFILAHFPPFPSTRCWEVGSWIHAVYFGEMEEQDPAWICSLAPPALSCHRLEPVCLRSSLETKGIKSEVSWFWDVLF